jgi:hypothetical protein
MECYSTAISFIQANHAIILLFIVKNVAYIHYSFLHYFGFRVVTLVYVGVVVSGFLVFGESTMSQFTLNLLPRRYIPSKTAIWMTI